MYQIGLFPHALILFPVIYFYIIAHMNSDGSDQTANLRRLIKAYVICLKMLDTAE